MKKKKKNFGCGNQLSYSVKNALNQHYDYGHFGTVSKYRKSTGYLITYMKENNLNDFNHLSKEEYIEFARFINDEKERGRFCTKTAQNIISGCNCALRIMRSDNYMTLSPSQYTGSRIDSLQKPPKWLNKDKQQQAYDYLHTKGRPLDALLIKFIDLTGCRLAEACKQNYKHRLKEAIDSGYIDITEGTKGGHGKYNERLIFVTSELLMTLMSLARIQGDHHSIIPRSMQFIEFYNNFSNRWRRIAKKFDLGGFNDFRKARAIVMYESITGYKAPIYGDKPAPLELDTRARLVIALAFGHHRISVTDAYLGKQHRVKNKT